MHSFGTLHLFELYVTKVEQVPEEHRKPAKLCPKTGLGIAKRLMVNIKNDIIRWMFAKMRVRRSLTPNLRNFDVLGMLKFSLWNPEIFPKDAFDELKKKYPGRANLDSVLDISPKLPENIAKQVEDKFQILGTKGQGFNQPFPQSNNRPGCAVTLRHSERGKFSRLFSVS